VGSNTHILSARRRSTPPCPLRRGSGFVQSSIGYQHRAILSQPPARLNLRQGQLLKIGIQIWQTNVAKYRLPFTAGWGLRCWPSAVWLGAGQDVAKISDEPLPRGLTFRSEFGKSRQSEDCSVSPLSKANRTCPATLVRELSVRRSAISQPAAALPIWVCGGRRLHSATAKQ
jgi:hypothetical protein